MPVCRTRRTARRVGPIACAGLLVCAALAACSSSGSSNNSTKSSSSSKSTAAKFTGPPIKVQISTALKTQFGDYTSSISAMKAAARAVNATGGIKGRELVVDSCNTQANPNQEIACGRQAVDDKVIATIGSLMVTNGADYLSILRKAGIADIASSLILPVFGQAANSYEVGFDAGSFAGCTGKTVTGIGGGPRIVSVLPDIPGAAGQQGFIKSAATAQKMDYVGNVAVPINVSDYGPIVQKIANLKPNVVVVVGAAPQVTPLLQAASLANRKFTYCTPVNAPLAAALKSVGKAADGNFYLASVLPPLSSAKDIPALNTFRSEMNAELAAGDETADVSGTKPDPNQLQVWLGMKILIQVAKSINGDINATSFQQALGKSTFSGLGIIPKLDFSAPAAYGIFTRVFNPFVRLQTWDAKTDQFVLVPNSEFNAAQAVNGPPK